GLGQSSQISVCASGPLVACIQVSHPSKGASPIVSHYSISRNIRWTWTDIELPAGVENPVLVIGMPKRAGERVFRAENEVATFSGPPGLGLALYVPAQHLVRMKEATQDHLVELKPDGQHHVRYAFGVFWEREHHENVVEQNEWDGPLPHVPFMERYGTTGRVLLRPRPMDTGEVFQFQLREDLATAVGNQPVVRLLSADATTYAAAIPPDAGRTTRKKGYNEALQLLIRRLRSLVEMQGDKFWFSSDPDGRPTFVNPNHSWGDGYLVSMLWDAYQVSGDPRFKEWALQCNRKMLGGEEIQKHVTGLNFWNASARSYLETKDPVWRESALKSADMLLRIADPATGLIPELGPAKREEPNNPYHQDNYIKIDALAGLPILWWAYAETKDEKYLAAANRHMRSAIARFIEPDGSALQQLWLDPKTGNVLGIGTTQGYGGNSRWSRGLAWVLDGFPDAYKATKDLKYLEAFRRSTKYLTENLPEDFVPWTDFDDQAVIWRYRDTSAAALCAYGLLRMSELDPDRELANRDRKFAIRILNSLVDHYLAPVGDSDPRPEGMLSHASYVKDVSGEYIWGNFGLMQALCWLQHKGIHRE